MNKKLQNTATSHEVPIQVFNPFAASKKYSYAYFSPSKGLEAIIDSHWSMHWDLRDDEPFRLELASSPYIALTFTQYGNFLTGINTGVYSYTIAGKGSLYGTLFKPTDFYQLYHRPLSELTNKELPAGLVFSEFDEEFSNAIAGFSDDASAIRAIESAIRAMRVEKKESGCVQAEKIISYSLLNPDQSIGQIAKQFKISERSLHLLFHEYVGVGVKWITVRDRLQKAMFIAAKSDNKPNWTAVAHELGYGDQPHFINDFKRVVGMSPSRYYRLLAHTK